MTDRPVLDEAACDLLFRKARSHNGWLDKPVSQETLRAAFDIAKMGPTSANCSPMRIIFVQTAEEKKRLEPALSSGNFDKTMNAPVTAIIANDYEFYEQFDFLFPHDDARSWFSGNQALIDTTAMRNGSLQGAYFMLACRAIGLDVGPMSGFENNVVDAEFFKDTKIRSNFLCNLGYGDTSKLFPRSPRFAFEEVCTLL